MIVSGDKNASILRARKIVLNGKYIGIVVAASALLLVGCSSSDDSPSGFVPSDLIIGESDTANAADDIDTLHLRRNAATLSSSSLGLNIIDQGLTLGTSLTGVVGQFADGFNSAQFDVSLSTGTVLEEDSSGAAKLSAGAFSYNLDASTSDGQLLVASRPQLANVLNLLAVVAAQMYSLIRLQIKKIVTNY